jgi:hypothetical protein
MDRKVDNWRIAQRLLTDDICYEYHEQEQWL